MRRRVLLDAGPLVAILDARDQYHEWAVSQWEQLDPPLLTCEAVLSEACFLVRHLPHGARAVMNLLENSAVEAAFRLEDHVASVSELMVKYANVPISLADACLVCMAEIQSGATVLTLDSDFRIYRKRNRQVVPVIMPEDI
jgi:predicted nucleic acid-binding protein